MASTLSALVADVANFRSSRVYMEKVLPQSPAAGGDFRYLYREEALAAIYTDLQIIRGLDYTASEQDAALVDDLVGRFPRIWLQLLAEAQLVEVYQANLTEEGSPNHTLLLSHRANYNKLLETALRKETEALPRAITSSTPRLL